MRIAVLGTGQVGRTLATALAGLGHEVVVGTRVPATTATREDWAGVDLELRAYDDLPDVELVVNATSGTSALEALALVGAERLDGLVLLDVANPLDFSAGFPPSLSVPSTDSLAEQIQRAHPGARVVKSLNTVTASVMVDPGSVPGETTMFVAGDDEGARATVVDLLRQLGWSDVVDLGALSAARGMEAYVLLWLRLFQAAGTPVLNVRFLR